MQVQMPKFAKISSDFICSVYTNNHWWPGIRPGPQSNCCLSLYLNNTGLQTGSLKMLLGSWNVLEMFVTKRVPCDVMSI